MEDQPMTVVGVDCEGIPYKRAEDGTTPETSLGRVSIVGLDNNNRLKIIADFYVRPQDPSAVDLFKLKTLASLDIETLQTQGQPIEKVLQDVHSLVQGKCLIVCGGHLELKFLFPKEGNIKEQRKRLLSQLEGIQMKSLPGTKMIDIQTFFWRHPKDASEAFLSQAKKEGVERREPCGLRVLMSYFYEAGDEKIEHRIHDSAQEAEYTLRLFLDHFKKTTTGPPFNEVLSMNAWREKNNIKSYRIPKKSREKNMQEGQAVEKKEETANLEDVNKQLARLFLQQQLERHASVVVDWNEETSTEVMAATAKSAQLSYGVKYEFHQKLRGAVNSPNIRWEKPGWGSGVQARSYASVCASTTRSPSATVRHQSRKRSGFVPLPATATKAGSSSTPSPPKQSLLESLFAPASQAVQNVRRGYSEMTPAGFPPNYPPRQ